MDDVQSQSVGNIIYTNKIIYYSYLTARASCTRFQYQIDNIFYYISTCIIYSYRLTIWVQ